VTNTLPQCLGCLGGHIVCIALTAASRRDAVRPGAFMPGRLRWADFPPTSSHRRPLGIVSRLGRAPLPPRSPRGRRAPPLTPEVAASRSSSQTSRGYHRTPRTGAGLFSRVSLLSAPPVGWSLQLRRVALLGSQCGCRLSDTECWSAAHEAAALLDWLQFPDRPVFYFFNFLAPARGE
jgi:hypothetical protein